MALERVDEDRADDVDRRRRDQHEQQSADEDAVALLPAHDLAQLRADEHTTTLGSTSAGAGYGAVMAWERLERRLGAVCADGETTFHVWAPAAGRVEVVANGRSWPLEPVGDDVHAARLPVAAGTDYRYALDGTEYADPCSRRQPEGLRGPSRALDTSGFEIADGPDLALEELVVYELHVGTFTRQGTFDGVIPQLPPPRARSDGDRADAGGDVPRAARLGL